MQADSEEFVKKVKVDVNSGEIFCRIQVNNLDKSLSSFIIILQERWLRKSSRKHTQDIIK